MSKELNKLKHPPQDAGWIAMLFKKWALEVALNYKNRINLVKKVYKTILKEQDV